MELIDMDNKKQWGGARPGAGRKAASIPKKQRNFRLTDEEYQFVKQALQRHRHDLDVPEPTPIYHVESKDQSSYENPDHATILAHLEDLQNQYINWQNEYCKWIRDANYDKHDPAYIKLMMQTISLQILTLQPHLLNISYDYMASHDYNKRQVTSLYLSEFNATLPNVEVKAWKTPAEGIDYQTTNLHIALNHKLIRKNLEKITKLEKEYDI